MYPFRYIMDTIRDWFRRRTSRNFRLEVDTLQSIKYLAVKEKLSPEEVADLIIVNALRDIEAQEDNYNRWQTLTRREKEVAALICRGYNTQEIAARLSIAKPTVKTHVTHILSKYDVPDRQTLRLLLKGWDFNGWDQM